MSRYEFPYVGRDMDPDMRRNWLCESDCIELADYVLELEKRNRILDEIVYSEGSWQTEFFEDLLSNMPSAFQRDDEPSETVAIRYVRYLEAKVGGTDA